MDKKNLTSSEVRLRYFNDHFRSSLAEREPNFELMQKQYQGSNEIISKKNAKAKPATVVRNITYELIESQISSVIPIPYVLPKCATKRMEKNARNATNLLKNLRDELPFENLNDIDERITYIFGTSIYYVEWDNKLQKVKINIIPPDCFVPEPNIEEINEMSYFFLTFTENADSIRQKYDVDLINISETDEIEVIVCYFKHNNVISKIVFSDCQEIEYVYDYYAKQKFDLESNNRIPVKEFELERNLKKSQVSIPKMSPVIIDGELQVEEVFDENSNKFIEVPKLKPTKLPFYKPKMFPIAIRKNVSKVGSVFGQSDTEIIRDQQQEINKLESRIMEKLLKAGVIPYSAETTNLRLSDEIYTRGIKLKNAQEKNLLGVMDLQVSIAQDVQQSERLYQQAKRILGISDSFQGMPDDSATSGVAKRLQISQSSGRLDSKRVMKNSAYAELDRLLFEFYLAFGESRRPIYSMNANGESVDADFCKYDYLEMNLNGEWKYNIEYLFSCDITSDVERDKPTMWAEIRKNYLAGLFGEIGSYEAKLIFWKNMLKSRYPNAKENIELILQQNNTKLISQNQVDLQKNKEVNNE